MTIVAYHIGSLGDTIVTIPALRLVRGHFPGATIVLLYNDDPHRAVSARTVLEGTGLVDEFVGYDATAHGYARIAMLARTLRILRRAHPSVGVYLAPSDRSAASVQRDRLFFRLCGMTRLAGFHHVRDPVSTRDAGGRLLPIDHEALRKIRRLQDDGVGVGAERNAMATPLFRWSESDESAARTWLVTHRHDDRPIVAVAPLTNMSAKVWPRDRFVAIGHRLIDAGYELAFVGGPGDRAVGDALVGAWGRGLNAAGAFGVTAGGAFLSHCAWHLGLDSGSTHLAGAAGIRCVAITSDTLPPGWWPPLGTGHIVVRRSVACGGCFHQICPVPGHPCMSDITVDDVWRAIEDGGLATT